jgi:ATP-dependent DNA helicase RecQ
MPTISSADARKTLKKTFGFSSFRSGQKEIIDEILDGRDVFAAMPTGGGDSLCYQLPALLLPGLTVVISPLVALMKDQVDGAQDNGIPAAFLNSSLTPEEAVEVYQKLEAGKTKLLYISPERFALNHFANQLKSYDIRLFAVDEAHCISEWGHDFRPDYRNLAEIRELFPESVIAAFTATATEKVQKDIIKLLALKQPFLHRASFNREELSYTVVPKYKTAAQVLSFISRYSGQPGIVYRTSRADVEKTAKTLAAHGIRALPYHAGLSAEVRKRNQDLFNRDEAEVIVATIAFGMGIDKSNIRFIIHADLPRSIEGYYQETGRAGRDGLSSECLLLFSRGDIVKIKYHIDKMQSSKEKKKAISNLNTMVNFSTSNVCRRKLLLNYFGEEHPEHCGNCDVCNGSLEKTDASVDAQKMLSAAVRSGERFGTMHIIDIVCGADTEKIRRFSHDALPTWGVGKDKRKIYWRSLAEELLLQKCLRRNDERYGAIELTEKGRKVLSGEAQFLISKVNTEPAGPAALTSDSSVMNSDLYVHLKDLRRDIASQKKVPPYIVFTDKTLREMAALRPDSEDSLLGVTGIGEKKLSAYGDIFLKAISAFDQKKG